MAKDVEMKAISVEIAVMVVDMVITFGTTLSFYDIGFEALGRMVQVSWFIECCCSNECLFLVANKNIGLL